MALSQCFVAYILIAAGFVGVCQAASAPQNPLQLVENYPELSTALRPLKVNSPSLGAYLEDTDTVCTMFVPTNQAMSDWMRWFGKYAGKAAQNATFLRTAFDYHTVPGKALTAEQIVKGGKEMTRANQTVFFWQQGGKPRVYSRRDYPVSFNKTNIKAGGCIVHSINMALVPPSDRQMIDAWVDEIGLRPDPAPQAQWAPEQLPLSMSLEASAAGKKDDAAAAAAGGDSAVAAAPAGGAGSKPATSSSDAARVGGARGLLLAAVAAAGLLL